jgi:ubiquinone/menaquinone biosynthesis C-methylase UbiE
MKYLLEFLPWCENDTLLSIGCGGAWWEINLLFNQPCKKLILIDFNSDLLNQETIEETIIYFENFYQKKLTTEIQLLNVDAVFSCLPDFSLDGILIFNTFHEIEHSSELIKECFRISKNNAFLFMEEEVSKDERILHQGCELPLFFESELISLLSNGGFHLSKKMAKDSKAVYFMFIKEKMNVIL